MLFRSKNMLGVLWFPSPSPGAPALHHYKKAGYQLCGHLLSNRVRLFSYLIFYNTKIRTKQCLSTTKNVGWQNNFFKFMVQVCGRVTKHYLERSEVGYLRFLTPRTKKNTTSHNANGVCLFTTKSK